MNAETLKLSQDEVRFFKSAIEKINNNIKPTNHKNLFILCCALRINKSLEALELLLENNHVHEAYSALRNLFETVIMLTAGWKYQDFEELKNRLYANFLVDKLDLINCNLESIHHTRFESIEETTARKQNVINELKILESKGIKRFSKNPTDNLASILNISKFKRHYYKMFSLYTHPNLHSIERFIKYNEENGTIQIIKDFKNDSEEGIRECIYNFIRISNSILNISFSLGFKQPDPNELLISAENTFIEIKE